MADFYEKKELLKEKKNLIRNIKQKARQDIAIAKKNYSDDVMKTQNYRQEKVKLTKQYSMGEEIFNSVSHGIGAGLSVAAIVLLIIRAVFNAPVGRTGITVTSFTLFGSSLFILYLMSTLYHALTPYGVKNVFQIFDHSSIYLLIAGTYTPYCLVGLTGNFGWVLFGVVWGLAVLGITLYSVFGNRMRLASAITYILMGWIVLFAFKSLYKSIPHASFLLLILGGVAYTAGCPFYMLKKIKWTHSIFHIFVLIGSIFHFFSVYFML